MIIRITDSYDGDIKYIKISEDQKRLLDWLYDIGVIRDTVDIEPSELPEIIEI